MVENSAIEWTNHTFNPWIGCQRVSAACDHCYAEALVNGRFGGDFSQRRRTSEQNWRQPVRWNQRAAAAGMRERVFCASLADVFDNRVDPAWRSDLWRLIDATPSLDWLLLTKRPQNIAAMLPADWGHAGRTNVWLGTTVENREEMLRRGSVLACIPAIVRFWSCEPLLEDLGRIAPELMPDWIIAGGESGPDARPMARGWVQGLRAHCAVQHVPFLFNQWGEWHPVGELMADGSANGRRPPQPAPLWHAWPNPNDEPMFRAGKKAAGRYLNGRLHDGVPRR